MRRSNIHLIGVIDGENNMNEREAKFEDNGLEFSRIEEVLSDGEGTISSRQDDKSRFKIRQILVKL